MFAPFNCLEQKENGLKTTQYSGFQPIFFWPARRDLNPQSSESESDALSNYATGGNNNNIISQRYVFFKQKI